MKWAKPEVHDAWWFCTPKERVFITNYLKAASNKNSATAAGCQDTAAGFRMLNKPHVRAALYQKTMEASTLAGIEIGQWWRETSMMAFMPMEMLTGKMTPADKLRALELLGKAGSIIRNNVHHSGEVGFLHLFQRATQELMEESSPPALEQTEGETLEHELAPETVEEGS